MGHLKLPSSEEGGVIKVEKEPWNREFEALKKYLSLEKEGVLKAEKGVAEQGMRAIKRYLLTLEV